jgi:hypothetical protein
MSKPHWKIQKDEWTKICIWNSKLKSNSSFKKILFEKIKKDKEKKKMFGISSLINQQNGNTRIDVWVKPESKEESITCLKEIFKRTYIRENISFKERKARNINIDKIRLEVPTIKKLELISWNVRSLKGKWEEVSIRLQSKKPTIIAMQETWRKEVPWNFKIAHYVGFEIPAIEGIDHSVGLALGVDRLSGLQIIQINPKIRENHFCIFGKILGLKNDKNEPIKMIICNIYIPSSKRIKAIKIVGKAIRRVRRKNKDSFIYLVGDHQSN